MTENPLIPLVEKALDREDLTLPIFNKIALELQKLMREREYSLADITKVIIKDPGLTYPGLTSDVLKMANSPFYGGTSRVKTVQDATVRLGSKTIFNLVTAVTQKELYRSKKKRFERWMKPLWGHSLGVAFASRWLSTRVGLRQVAEESFMAGLLHDIGKLIILRGIEDLDSSQLGPEELSEARVDDMLEEIHAAQGERLMSRMNMPETYCRASSRPRSGGGKGRFERGQHGRPGLPEEGNRPQTRPGD